MTVFEKVLVVDEMQREVKPYLLFINVLEVTENKRHDHRSLTVFDEFLDHVSRIVTRIKVRYVDQSIRVTREDSRASAAVDDLSVSGSSFRVMMIVYDCGTRIVCDLIQGVAEVRDRLSGVLVTLLDLVEWIYDDGLVRSRVTATSDYLRRELVDRSCVASEIPRHDVRSALVAYLDAHRVIHRLETVEQ